MPSQTGDWCLRPLPNPLHVDPHQGGKILRQSGTLPNTLLLTEMAGADISHLWVVGVLHIGAEAKIGVIGAICTLESTLVGPLDSDMMGRTEVGRPTIHLYEHKVMVPLRMVKRHMTLTMILIPIFSTVGRIILEHPMAVIVRIQASPDHRVFTNPSTIPLAT